MNKNKPAFQESLVKGLDLTEVLALSRIYWKWIATVVFTCVTLSVAIAYLLPKQFKAMALLNISSKYFKNPLVGDFVPEITDSIELKVQREVLIHTALNREFLLELFHKKGILKAERNSPEEKREFDLAVKLLEIFSVQPTVFQVSFADSSPQKSFEVVNEVLNRITTYLQTERRTELHRLKNALESKLRGEADSFEASPEELGRVQNKLENIQSQLAKLSEVYSPSHPQLQALKQEKNRLELEVVKLSEVLNAQTSNTVPSSTRVDHWVKEFFDSEAGSRFKSDLASKVSRLRMLLEMDGRESSNFVSIMEAPVVPLVPISPKKKIIVTWGVGLGLFIAYFGMLVLELFKRREEQTVIISQKLDLKYLGKLPPYSSFKQQKTMSDSPNHFENNLRHP